MFDFVSDPSLPKPARYRQLVAAAQAVTQGETDAIANMAVIEAVFNSAGSGQWESPSE